MLPQSLWVPIASVLLCPGLCAYTYPTSSSNLSTSSSAEFAKPWEEVFEEDVPCRTESPKASHSWHCLAVALCICCRWKVASSMRAEQDSLWTQQNAIGSHFVATFLQQNSSIWFPPYVYGLSRLRLYKQSSNKHGWANVTGVGWSILWVYAHEWYSWILR